jgi:hypothetical protein
LNIRFSNPEQRMGSSSLVQQTPGDPGEPTSGEPTIMAFRRPADRPGSVGGKSQSGNAQSFGDPDALPIVLRLPDLSREVSEPPTVAAVGTTRPWIGIVMWCATGALAVVAAVLIFTGKPESPPAADEAPQWRSDSAATGGPQNARGAGDAGAVFDSGRPMDGAAGTPAANTSSSQMVNGSGRASQGFFPGREHVPSGEPSAAANFSSDPAPLGSPPSAVPGAMIPAGSSPGNTAPGSSLPPSGQRQPPTNESSPPTGLDGEWPPAARLPDESKLQTNGPRSAVQPNTARLGGGIQYLETRPTTR